MSAAAAATPALQAQKGLLSSFTRVCKAICAVLIGGYLLTLISRSFVLYFALMPGRTIPLAWNLFTCAFLETKLLYLLIDVAAVLYIGRLLEPVWGTKEFVRFVFVVSTTTAISTFVLIFIVYCFTLQGRLLYAPISGFHGVIAGFLVAIKQTMPEQELPSVKLRVKWLPSILILVVILRTILLQQGLLYIPFIVLGTLNAWIYLRFYQVRGESGIKGDASEDFSFASFFPEPARPFVAPVAAVVGRLLCGRRQQQGDGNEMMSAGMPLPGSHPIEASRRRERGARALEERLNKVAEAGATPEKKGAAVAAAEESVVSVPEKDASEEV